MIGGDTLCARARLRRDESRGRWVATCPELPELGADAATPEEALAGLHSQLRAARVRYALAGRPWPEGPRLGAGGTDVAMLLAVRWDAADAPIARRLGARAALLPHPRRLRTGLSAPWRLLPCLDALAEMDARAVFRAVPLSRRVLAAAAGLAAGAGFVVLVFGAGGAVSRSDGMACLLLPLVLGGFPSVTLSVYAAIMGSTILNAARQHCCVGCRYDLSGLPPEVPACPECAMPRGLVPPP